MRIGSLRHEVTIQSLAEGVNVAGDTVATWSDVATVWADIQPLSAREFIAGQALQSDVSARITIRYLEGITAAMRVVHGATIYNIRGVLPDQASGREYLTLPCSQGVNNG